MIPKYVVDSCVTGKLFIVNEPEKEKAIQFYRLAYTRKVQLLAPSLIWYELNNLFVKTQMPIKEVKENIAIIQEQIERGILEIHHPSSSLLIKANEIAKIPIPTGRGYLSSLDATFHALAILQGATFITADEKHYKKTKGIKELEKSIILLRNFI